LKTDIIVVMLNSIFKIIYPLVRRLYYFFEIHNYEIRQGIAKGLRRKGGLSFIPQIFPHTPEEIFLLNLNLKSKTIYDVGGFEGILTIFFANAVGDNGTVITFEPNPKNYQKLVENVKINNFGNLVKIYQLAIGEKKGKVTFAYSHFNPAQGSIQYSSRIGISRGKGEHVFQVDIDSLDNQLKTKSFPKPDMIKIDVEGSEFDVLCGMKEIIRNFKPELFIEIHGINEENRVKNIQDVVDFLISNGYSIYHIESCKKINRCNTPLAKEGHLYAY